MITLFSMPPTNPIVPVFVADAATAPAPTVENAKATDSKAKDALTSADAEQIDYIGIDDFSKVEMKVAGVLACAYVEGADKLLQFTLDDGTGKDRTILSGIHAYYEPEELVGKTLIAITNLPPRAMMGIESCGMLLSAVNNLKDSEDEELHLLMVDDHIPAGAKLY